MHAIAVVHGNLTSVSCCWDVELVLIRRQFTVLVDSHGRGFVRGSGLSTILDEIAESKAVGTHPSDVRWTAPELVVGGGNFSSRLPTSKSDVWSFGCIMIHVRQLIRRYSHRHLTTVLPRCFLGRSLGRISHLRFNIVYHRTHKRSESDIYLSSMTHLP